MVAATRCLFLRGGRERRPDQVRQLAGVLVEQREIQLELAREVLVQNGFGDPCTVGDVVHGSRVVANLDEYLLRGLEQLRPPCGARQPYAAATCVRTHRHW
jgi:hypothetical protein